MTALLAAQKVAARSKTVVHEHLSGINLGGIIPGKLPAAFMVNLKAAQLTSATFTGGIASPAWRLNIPVCIF